MEITFLSNDGGGFASKKHINEGTSLASFLSSQIGDVDPSRYVIRVNRMPAEVGHVLMAGDVVSITPTKIQGA